MFRFFSKPYTYESGVSVSSTGGSTVSGHPETDAIDNDKSSYWENDGATPSFIVDLGVARTIDCLYMKSSQILTFALYHSDNGSSWTQVTDGDLSEEETGIFWLFDFTEVSKRYWKVEVLTKDSGNVRIYELMLFEGKFTLADDVGIVKFKDTIGVSYLMADGASQTASGLRLYAHTALRLQNISKSDRDNLFTLFSLPTPRYPLAILPDDNYPEGVYRVTWGIEDFPLEYSNQYTGSGFSGTFEFREY